MKYRFMRCIKLLPEWVYWFIALVVLLVLKYGIKGAIYYISILVLITYPGLTIYLLYISFKYSDYDSFSNFIVNERKSIVSLSILYIIPLIISSIVLFFIDNYLRIKILAYSILFILADICYIIYDVFRSRKNGN